MRLVLVVAVVRLCLCKMVYARTVKDTVGENVTFELGMPVQLHPRIGEGSL